MRQARNSSRGAMGAGTAPRFARGKWLVVLAALATLTPWAASQSYLIQAQLEYQNSRLAAYYQQRAEQALVGALPAGDYALTLRARCEPLATCATLLGFPPPAAGQQDFVIVLYLTSDGRQISYRAAAAAGASEVMSPTVWSLGLMRLPPLQPTGGAATSGR